MPATPFAPPPDPHAVTGAGPTPRPRWQARLWLLAGFLCLIVGLIGVVLPLLPTTPFVLLAAYCFSRGSARWEHWLLTHPRLGPLVHDWRQHHAVPLRAKQLATGIDRKSVV